MSEKRIAIFIALVASVSASASANPPATPAGLSHRAHFEHGGIVIEGSADDPDWRWQLHSVGTSAGPLEGIQPANLQRRPDGRVEYYRGDIVEQYLPTPRGIEQRFVIPAPLNLGGRDLIIRGQVRSSARHFEERLAGWVWYDGRGTVSLRRPFVFDAGARPIPADLRVTRDGTELIVCGAGLAGAAYPVIIDPEIGEDDLRLSSVGPEGAAGFEVSTPRVAYNSTAQEYLVVWVGDHRSSPSQPPDLEIFAQRVSADGTPIGGNYRISDMGGAPAAEFFATHPDVVYSRVADEYLVVWEGSDDHGALIAGALEIFGQRLDGATGTEIGTNDFVISSAGPDGTPSFEARAPAVAYNHRNNEYLVVWHGTDDQPGLHPEEREVFGQRINASSGTAVGPVGFRITAMGADEDPAAQARNPAVAYNEVSNEFLVVWEGSESDSGPGNPFALYGQRLSAPTASPVGAAGFAITDLDAPPAAAPALAHNSTDNHFVVIWEASLPVMDGQEQEIFGRRLDGAGDRLDESPLQISRMGPDGDGRFDARTPQVSYSRLSNEYFVVWRGDHHVLPLVDNEREIFGRRVDADGNLEIGFDDVRLSSMGPDSSEDFDAEQPALAFNTEDNEYLIVWRGDDDRGLQLDDDFEIFAQRYTIASEIILLSESPGPARVDEAVPFSFEVFVPIGVPEGSVTIRAGEDVCTADAATGECLLTFTTTGKKQVQATYEGDRNYGRSVSEPLPYVVEALPSDTVIRSLDPTPSDVGQAVVAEYRVSPEPGSGTVTVTDGSRSCTAPALQGACTLVFDQAGAREIVATFSGDDRLAGSSSPARSHTVRFRTTVTLGEPMPNPSTVGSPVQITFEVADGGSPILGTVTVSDGTNSCQADVADGGCTLVPSTDGSRSLIASYPGSPTHTPASSAPREFEVLPDQPAEQPGPDLTDPCGLEGGLPLPFLPLTLLGLGWMGRRRRRPHPACVKSKRQ